MTRTWKGNINRAILDASSAFNSLGKVLEEYLTNPLDRFEELIQTQVVDPKERQQLKMVVTINRQLNQLIIFDEHPKMGMSGATLFDQFFNIHGENQARVRHVNVRGKHGTGKSAAFGLGAVSMTIDTTHEGIRHRVTTTLKSLQQTGGNEGALLNVEVDGEKTKRPNGTMIIIQLPSSAELNARVIISAVKHIKKVFTTWLHLYDVQLNEINTSGKNISQLRVTYTPKDAAFTENFASPSSHWFKGASDLVIKRAGEPIESGERGITITANGFAKEITLFGLDRERFSEYFFGEWEIPTLDTYTGPNPPSLSTRDLTLNQQNEIVQELYAYGKSILLAQIQKFSQEMKKLKEDEQAKLLSKVAEELATILNTDFEEYADQMKAGKGTGKNVPDPTGKKGNTGGQSGGTGGPGTHHPGTGKPPTQKTHGKGGARQGGFKIDFAHLSHNLFIARYDEITRVITVNLDAQFIKAALHACGGFTESRPFKILCYKAAVGEYARALVSIAESKGELSSTSREEILQEGLALFTTTQKRVLDKLSQSIDLPLS